MRHGAQLGFAMKKNDTVANESLAIRFGHLFWALSNRIAGIVSKPTHFACTLKVDRSPREVYAFWRDFNNLARATRGVDHVDVRDARHSHWVIAAPFGIKLSWSAEITIDDSQRRIGWKTTAPADIPHVGQVIFRGADDDHATEIAVAIDYRAPLGMVGQLVGRWLGGGADAFINEELRLFKEAIESEASPLREEELTGTEQLLREARDVTSGGAVHHPENIHEADERSRAALKRPRLTTSSRPRWVRRMRRHTRRRRKSAIASKPLG